MTSVRKEFLKRLEHLKDNRKDVIDGLTEICSLNSKYAKVITDTLFEEFKEVLCHFFSNKQIRPNLIEKYLYSSLWTRSSKNVKNSTKDF